MAVTATGYITDDDLKAALQASLGKVEANEIDSDIWDANIARRNLGAYTQIKAAWLTAGFAVADIEAWIEGPHVQEGLALYEVLIKQKPNSERVSEWRKELDYWRQYLKDQVEAGALATDSGLASIDDDEGLFEVHTVGR